MSTDQPLKRLVSTGRYVRLLTERTSLTLGAIFSLSVGMITLFAAVTSLLTAFNRQLPIGPAIFLEVGGVLACISAGMFFTAFRFYKKERKIERVAPITRQNAHLLPSKDSLVRASDVPASQLQTELLRAAQYGTATPADELLRATTNRQDA